MTKKDLKQRKQAKAIMILIVKKRDILREQWSDLKGILKSVTKYSEMLEDSIRNIEYSIEQLSKHL